MSSKVYVNGNYFDKNDAVISVFDRGFLFSDSIYEVTAVINGLLVDWKAHYSRMEQSLKKINLDFDIKENEIFSIIKNLVDKNNIKEGLVYIQVTRGVGERDFNFSEIESKPTIVIFTQDKKILNTDRAKKGIKIVTLEEERWKRRDIKTTQLLAPSMAKTEASKRGKDDCWFIENGYITEGSSSNAFIVNDNNQIVTRKLSHDLLGGITRSSLLSFCKKNNLKFIESKFTELEAKNAREAFITSATSFVVPVIEIDGNKIGTGVVGSFVKEIQTLYLNEIQERLS